MVSMAVALGAEKQKAESEMLDVLNFEIALANVSYTNTSFYYIKETNLVWLLNRSHGQKKNAEMQVVSTIQQQSKSYKNNIHIYHG